jgi:hypothetical protein
MTQQRSSPVHRQPNGERGGSREVRHDCGQSLLLLLLLPQQRFRTSAMWCVVIAWFPCAGMKPEAPCRGRPVSNTVKSDCTSLTRACNTRRVWQSEL